MATTTSTQYNTGLEIAQHYCTHAMQQFAPEGPGGANARVNRAISANAGSIEQAEDVLILFDVAGIFAVVRRNADCSPHRGFLAPDAGAGDCGAGGELARAAQLAELDAHAVERTIKLCDVTRAAIVGGDCKDAEHFRIGAIGGTDFTAHL